MKQVLLQEKFPMFKLEIDKTETTFNSSQELVDYFKQLIDEHKITRFIGEFDHYSHTKGLEGGEMAEDIIDARNVVFCFGTKLPKAEMLAVRPRSIGIAETETGFTISFMEAPMALANDTMEAWVKGVVIQATA
ncbi:MAG: hypothetical protein HOM14_11470 [Gammaproteobacteria bacterium]|jgi:hypothetical protein|nr:hypothetical protein [Gammaproteobacteria bacterium]MBT3722224.1 hypothetical protein [Gammaproteobacteria bacterium]MBT4076093.1 hypothetical protein [Gammaproteobacteria bacterium]MBT4193541.1 hypothetical protein [Gammaproteobacteria bacterium]MBT4452202.1 hypothetical protein [Gammaproteobacteria bacterium]